MQHDHTNRALSAHTYNSPNIKTFVPDLTPEQFDDLILAIPLLTQRIKIMLATAHRGHSDITAGIGGNGSVVDDSIRQLQHLQIQLEGLQELTGSALTKLLIVAVHVEAVGGEA
ncbi:MAG: hypothetical protein ACPGSM_12925 [Thiolinea sp.]